MVVQSAPRRPKIASLAGMLKVGGLFTLGCNKMIGKHARCLTIEGEEKHGRDHLLFGLKCYWS